LVRSDETEIVTPPVPERQRFASQPIIHRARHQRPQGGANEDRRNGKRSGLDAFDAACDLEVEALGGRRRDAGRERRPLLREGYYLIERERHAWGTELTDSAHFGLLALAAELHTKGPDALEALAGVPAAVVDPIFAAIQRHEGLWIC
jgi:hypothetical protein